MVLVTARSYSITQELLVLADSVYAQSCMLDVIREAMLTDDLV